MSGIVLLILRILLTASLYAFLGLALYTLWRDLQNQARLLASRKPPALALVRLDTSTAIVRRFAVAEIIIGRDLACTFPLEDSTVSAQHTRLVFRQGQWWVEDLHSTNGTFLNQELIITPLVVASGDELRCGQARLQILLGDENTDQRL